MYDLRFVIKLVLNELVKDGLNILTEIKLRNVDECITFALGIIAYFLDEFFLPLLIILLLENFQA